MRISKKSVLLAMSGMFTMASLGLMYVFAENLSNGAIDLNIDPSNAIQHFKEVKIISSGVNDESYAIINKKGNLIGIETDYNFVLRNEGKIKCDIDGDGVVEQEDTREISEFRLGRSTLCNKILCDINNDGDVNITDFDLCVGVINGQDDYGWGSRLVNQISKGVRWASILGGMGNKIERGLYNGILGGKENKIEGEGKYNSILGGIANVIGSGKNSVIFGGRGNEIGITGSYSSIVGGEGNKVMKSYAVAIGKNNIANGYNSVAMGSGSKVQSENSFLWSDDNSQDRLSVKGVFAVKGEKGMVINTTKAHDLAQLTVSGSLVVYDNKNTLECAENTQGVLKVIDGDIYNNNQKCFCSCDGSGRNALHEGTRCEALCSNGTGLQAECGMVRVDCETTPYSYTGAGTSGACIVGELVEGTGAFLVDTQNDNTEWIHRSCQTTYGQVTGCMQQLIGESCPNLRTGYECIWDHEELTGHLITNPNPPVDSATFWKYNPELDKPCTYMCDQYGEWDPNQGKCIFHECRGELPEGAKLNDEMALPLNDTTDYFYSTTLTGACSYKCNIEFGYYYSGTLNKCVTCPEGQAYDENDGTCKVACDMSNTSFETITIMDESGYAITIADRNLGATSNNTGEVSSYGCYFQWGNNYGFQPQGNLETSTDFVDTSAYGPGNPYISEIFRVRTGEMRSGGLIVYGPNDDDWSSPANHNLWGGAYDSGNNAFGVLDSDKENRRGPCPEGYHVPSIGERNDLLTIWYNKEYKSAGSGNLPYIKDSEKIISFRGTGDAGLGWAESMRFVKAFRDYFKLPPASSREFDDFAPGITYGQGGSFWTSSSPRLTGSFTSNSLAKNRIIRTNPNNANSFDYNLIGEGYIGHGLAGRKMSAQSVRCFKDVPECPSGSIWNQSELKCESVTDCDMEHTAIQDLELFFIGGSGDISHYMMMDRNLGAFEVYNQKGESDQNARSLGCHFQWGNNYGFHLGTPTTRYGINPMSYGPNNYYSNNKFYCYVKNSAEDPGEAGEETPEDDESIFGVMYSPKNYHMRGGGYIKSNGDYKYGAPGSDEDRQGPCPEGYHIPGGIEMKNLVDKWNDASASQGAVGKKFASDLLMPYGRYIEVYCGQQNSRKKGGGIWLSDAFYYKKPEWSGGTYANHLQKFTDTSSVGFASNGFAHGFPIRCVKNGMTTSEQKVTIHPDGGTGFVIAIDWETEGTGKITSLGTPTKNGINFLGWYSSQSFAAEFKVNTGDYISSGGHLYARWDGCNIVDTAVQDLEVFFLLSPSRISHYVMMDRNLGATEAFNQDISSPNRSSYGCYFQWGNNYPFNRKRNGDSYTTETFMDVNNYGSSKPNGYYRNSSRYCILGSGKDLMYPLDGDSLPKPTWLWGGGYFDGTEYKDGRGIDGTDIDRQGPCPTGYHIPKGVEMDNIMREWKEVSNYPKTSSEYNNSIGWEKAQEFVKDLLLPLAGVNDVFCPGKTQSRSIDKGGSYWISDYYYRKNPITSKTAIRNHLYVGQSNAGNGIYFYPNGPAHGYSLRCVKNNISDTPQKVTINAYGGTGAVIAIDWESAENGRIVTLGEPKKDGYDFGGWYYNESLTTEIKVGDSISNGGDIYAKWIIKDCDIANTVIQDLELFFLSETGNISHYMMMDRSLGATEVYNQDYNSPNQTSFGCYFQWGNNYPFNRTNLVKTQTQVDVTGYGPNNYYSHNQYFCNTDEERINRFRINGTDWMDLRGGVTNTETSKKGPCPTGYHIPHSTEFKKLIEEWKVATTITGGRQFANDTLTPFNGGISPRCNEGFRIADGGSFWMANANSSAGSICHLSIGNYANGVVERCKRNSAVHSFPVRCVKNDMDTAPQKITIHANGGTGAVISIDWETEESGKIMTLGEPSRLGYKFEGWYLDTGFNNPINTGDYISNDGHLYAKWDELIAVFMEGSGFNNILSSLAGVKGNINSIKRTDTIVSGVTTGLISDVNSPAPIIARYDSGLMYYYTEANKVYLNENSQGMFEAFVNLEQIDMSGWNTSNVINMSAMFSGCESLLTLDLSDFDTSSVTNMSYMFNNCGNLTSLNVSGWNTTNVTTMRTMFSRCENLTHLDVSSFDTSSVTDMAAMFNRCEKLTDLNVNNFDTSNVTKMGDMFNHCTHLKSLDLSNFNTSNVTTMFDMFTDCYELTGLDLGNFDTSNVTDMSMMFQACRKLESINLSSFDTSNVISMKHMFAGSNSLKELNLSNFNTSKVTNMERMFASCHGLKNLNISSFDTSKVTNMEGMFRANFALTGLDLRNFNTNKVTDMASMFSGSVNLKMINLSSFDTSNVKKMDDMFGDCYSLETIYASTGFVTTSVTDSTGMFSGDVRLIGGNGTRYTSSHVDKYYAKIDKPGQTGYLTEFRYTTLLPGNEFRSEIVRLAGGANNIKQILYTGNMSIGTTTGIVSVGGFEPVVAGYKNGIIYLTTDAIKIYLNEDASAMFSGLSIVTKIDTTKWDTIKATDMSNMFKGCSGLLSLDISDWNTSNVTNMSSMFENCYSLTNLDVSRWNTSNVSDISRMFVDCSSLEELDVSNWNTSNVTNMFAVFGGNNNYMNLKHLDVSNWDTSKVTTMRSMFRNCINLTGLDVSNWNTSNVENMYMLFGAEYDYMNLEYIDVSNWDTSKVTNMRGTFRNCIKLTGLDISKWNTSNVIDMRFMFASMAKNGGALPMNLENLDVSNWDTSSVTDMGDMFQNCVNLSGLDVSNWNTSNVTDMEAMFYKCSKLTKLDVSNWDTSNVTNMDAMFYKCSNLTELDLTNRKTNKVTNMSFIFNSNTNLKTIYASTGFVTTKVTSDTGGDYLFYGDTKLVGGFGTRYSSSHVHIEYAKIDSESESGYFTQLKATYLLPGTQFNQTIKRLAGQNSATYNTSNTTITQIKQWTGNDIPSGVTTGLLSQNDSVYPTYAWFKNGIIYYYTKADRMYMNPDSSYMFNMLKNLKNVDMSEWKTNRVTNMEGIFGGCSSLTELNLINWNTSNVTNMKGMFSGCSSLTELDISNFYTRNVTDMSSMFDSCNALTQLNLEGIHTENVTNMQRMFYGCHSLTELDVSNFDISNVTNLSMMFENDSNLTSLDVSNWDTSNVTDMSRVFVDCSKIENLDVSNWNTSKVTSMYGLFAGDDNGMSLKYLDVSNFDTSKVTNMRGVFRNCIYLTSVDVSNWDTSNVTDMSMMFYGNSGFNMNFEYVDVSNFDTSKVTDMSDMFQSCIKLTNLDVSKWNTSKVTDMNYMFNYCKKLTNLDVSKWNTSGVTNMDSLFGECNNLTELDLSNWDTNKVTSMKSMFSNCKNLKTIYASTGFVTTQVTDSTKMFDNDKKLVGGFGTKYTSSKTDNTYAKIDSEFQSGYFTQLKASTLLSGKMFNQMIKRLAGQDDAMYSTSNTTITQIVQWTGSIIPSGVTTGLISTNDSAYPIYAWFNNSGIIYYYTEANKIYLNPDSSYTFYGMSGLTGLNLSSFDTSNVINMSSMFGYCSGLIELDLSNFNTSNVINMSSMFRDCRSLTKIDLSNFDTSNVTTMHDMFDWCINLTELDISSFDTSKVTRMSQMFQNCNNLTKLDLSNFDTSNVTTMQHMFTSCHSLKDLDISSFNTSNVTDMSTMFSSTQSLTGIDLTNFDTSNVTNMRGMFAYCINLKELNLSNFDTSNVTNMGEMFKRCESLTGLNLNNFQTNKLGQAYGMFSGAYNLRIVDLSSFDTSNIENMSSMFMDCRNLKTIYTSSSFVTSGLKAGDQYHSDMFLGDTKLVGGNGTEYSSSHTNKEYARIDQPGTPGYFTLKQ